MKDKKQKDKKRQKEKRQKDIKGKNYYSMTPGWQIYVSTPSPVDFLEFKDMNISYDCVWRPLSQILIAEMCKEIIIFLSEYKIVLQFWLIPPPMTNRDKWEIMPNWFVISNESLLWRMLIDTNGRRGLGVENAHITIDLVFSPVHFPWFCAMILCASSYIPTWIKAY